MGITLGKTKAILCLLCLSAVPAWGDGHGPAFGFSTTTLGSGDASVETAVTWRSGVAMIGPQFSYGIRENVQLSVSAPFDINQGEHPVDRFTSMMPGIPAAEVLLAWRFHHSLTGIGTRNEATLYAGGSAITQHLLRNDGPPLQRQPGFYGAIAVGHISRRYNVWAGAGYQHYAQWSSGVQDHESDSLLTSLVFGWRPPFLDKEYPKPDWRFFWETTGEQIGLASRQASDATTSGSGGDTSHGAPPPLPPPNSSGLIVLPDSGGRGVYSGPTFLCTFRSVAFQGGVLFALWNQLNGTQPAERFRAVVGVSYFFLGRHK
jgi:hypothetical protein